MGDLQRPRLGNPVSDATSQEFCHQRRDRELPSGPAAVLGQLGRLQISRMVARISSPMSAACSRLTSASCRR